MALASHTRNKLPQSVEVVRKLYDDGTLNAPCVLMQCLEFNVDFWKELVSQNVEALKIQIKLAKRKRGQSQEVDENPDIGDDPERGTSARKSARR